MSPSCARDWYVRCQVVTEAGGMAFQRASVTEQARGLRCPQLTLQFPPVLPLFLSPITGQEELLSTTWKRLWRSDVKVKVTFLAGVTSLSQAEGPSHPFQFLTSELSSDSPRKWLSPGWRKFPTMGLFTGWRPPPSHMPREVQLCLSRGLLWNPLNSLRDAFWRENLVLGLVVHMVLAGTPGTNWQWVPRCHCIIPQGKNLFGTCPSCLVLITEYRAPTVSPFCGVTRTHSNISGNNSPGLDNSKMTYLWAKHNPEIIPTKSRVEGFGGDIFPQIPRTFLLLAM